MSTVLSDKYDIALQAVNDLARANQSFIKRADAAEVLLPAIYEDFSDHDQKELTHRTLHYLSRQDFHPIAKIVPVPADCDPDELLAILDLALNKKAPTSIDKNICAPHKLFIEEKETGSELVLILPRSRDFAPDVIGAINQLRQESPEPSFRQPAVEEPNAKPSAVTTVEAIAPVEAVKAKEAPSHAARFAPDSRSDITTEKEKQWIPLAKMVEENKDNPKARTLMQNIADGFKGNYSGERICKIGKQAGTVRVEHRLFKGKSYRGMHVHPDDWQNLTDALNAGNINVKASKQDHEKH